MNATIANTDAAIHRIAAALADRGLTLGVAESCTGGLVTKCLTDRPGASRFFVGGVVTYADESKRSLLGVRRDTLTRYGSVSGETAREMLIGIRRLLQTDAAVAITGIAGPGGGSAEKPVGTVWYGASVREESAIRQERFEGSRPEIRARSAEAVLGMLERLLCGKEGV